MIRYYASLLIELATRIVHILGITAQLNAVWMLQIVEDLVDADRVVIDGKSHLIRDRGSNCTVQSPRLIARYRTAMIRLPPSSPNLGVNAERFVRSAREKCFQEVSLIG